jgi:hypothetical protein
MYSQELCQCRFTALQKKYDPLRSIHDTSSAQAIAANAATRVFSGHAFPAALPGGAGPAFCCTATR